MWAEILAKEMEIPEGLEIALVNNTLMLPSLSINEVVNVSGEIYMKNIRNREQSCSSQKKSIQLEDRGSMIGDPRSRINDQGSIIDD